jgi:hypothetical protein
MTNKKKPKLPPNSWKMKENKYEIEMICDHVSKREGLSKSQKA